MGFKVIKIIILSIIIFNLFIAQGFAASGLTYIKEGNDRYIIEDYQRFKSIKSPAVGLALTGGGAPALFNVGVIKALEEEGIPIDLIVGSSMGAIVGTMYGSGLPITTIEDVLMKVSFNDMLKFNFIASSSLLDTARVNKFIEEIALTSNLEDFVIPTALLSFDLSNGDKYLATTGKISKVIQSSYSIPFYFPMYNSGDKFLVDAGIVEISPAKSTKVLGADIVIATIIPDNSSSKEYDTPGRSFFRYISLVQKRYTEQIIENYADIVIEGDVANYSFMDFKSIKDYIEIGYKSTKAEIPKIKRLLSEKNIPLKENNDKSLDVNYSNKINDVKYDRLLLEKTNLAPTFYYGKDNSFFKQELIKSPSHHLQYGLRFNKEHLGISALSSTANNKQDDVELKVRWTKLTEDIDLLSNYRWSDNRDYLMGLVYYDDKYTIGGGRGYLNKNNFIYLDNNYKFDEESILLEGENDLLFPFENSKLKILTSHQANYQLNNFWTLEPKFIFNNTETMESPLIYRGIKPDPFVKLQLSLNLAYNHKNVDEIEFIDLLKLTDMQTYLFTDYQKEENSSVAIGAGSRAKLGFLGLKPLDVEGYLAYDNEDKDFNLAFNLYYDF
ncbi:NTE family protein [Orenia metallireducens]|uniref:NTE family protein n=1 Tax=Orenia metallireducens TaxID=1413210 RepID=A0A285IIA6_9FIRM|nr:patatin-like phospholipase family protein [Orenia metallireducens]PRX17465.1 NTE family protein [Orenia metallireducens]SNY47527.1 NTE family protein [Orenia metallireducens]